MLTVTNRELFFKTEDEFSEVNTSNTATSFILEPFGRNTAAAIATAALHIAKAHGLSTAMLVLAADHLITDQNAFAAAVDVAVALAQTGSLVTFGISPEAAETGYGYIETDGNKVVRFVEKPSSEKAQEYIDKGNFLWNSGMFCFQAGAMLKAMEQYCPEILSRTQICMAQSRTATGKAFAEITLDPETFALVPDDSIDYSVMERSDQILVVPCNIGWSDIGSWSALGDLSVADEGGNRINGTGEALLHDVTNCYVQSNKRLVGAVGINNLIIVDTPDALLVADKSRAQDVKKIFAALKLKDHNAHKHHLTVHRPWGTYTVLEENTSYKLKRIEVKPGGQLSLQMHHHRSEHWIVVSGNARVVNGDKEIDLESNQSTYIPAGHKHRLENTGDDMLVMIEVQCGSYLGEDDIVRFQDNYGRV